MRSVRLLVGVVLVAGVAPATASAAEIHVPADASTLQVAIGRAQPGDRIVLAEGTYPGGNVVPKGKHDLTIVGEDRSEVVLDGGGLRKNGIVVHADGVAILNMSAHGFLENAFYWDDADRFRASYLTVWNVRGYGIYTEDSSRGVIDHDYVSGAADAAYYVGECNPCRATIHHVTAALSAVGYSGTNATSVVVRDSVWDRNGAGIVPNTYANEALPPQARNTIVRNTITGSGRARVPVHTALAPFIGIGVAIAGGNHNVVRGNRVTGSERYGIAVFPTARYVTFDPSVRRDPGPPWRPRGNRIAGNTVSGSGRSDLALSLGSGPGNCFVGNVAPKRLPPGLSGCAAPGDTSVAAALTAPLHVMFDAMIRRRRPPSYLSMPVPPAQPEMPAGGQRS
ncbi:MAG TPA: right-handed parallel beta-helix repeat-containing protein [Gaiellaceae bacterium]